MRKRRSRRVASDCKSDTKVELVRFQPSAPIITTGRVIEEGSHPVPRRIAEMRNLYHSTCQRSVGQSGRPLVLGARCRGFESLHSDHFDIYTYRPHKPTKESLVVEKEGVHKLSELDWKDRMIADETRAKYKAYTKIAELQQEIEKLKKRLKDE